MTSLLWRHVYIERRQLVQYFTHSFTTCQVLNVIASYEYQKNECVQQWNLLKCQTSTFYFSTYCQNLFDTYWYTPVRLYERRDCCDRWISRWNNTSASSFFFNNTFSSTSKLLTPNMYCWSCKTLLTIYWTHLRVNGIWATSFCQEKMNNRTLFLTGCFQR